MENEAKKGMTYRDAGVDIDAGNRLVDLIKPLLKKTYEASGLEVLGDLRGFSGCIRIPGTDLILSAGTDGVGTKLKIAFILDKHDTVGIDLVGMCANDIVVNGSRPLAFLDYLATGKLAVEKAATVISGIAEGCVQARCALIGGETAEMPGFYGPGEYDLAGFCVGLSPDEKCIISGENIKPGTKIFGAPSSGLHSNGFSLVRKIIGIDDDLFAKALGILSTYVSELGCTWGEELLKPTKIYVQMALDLINNPEIEIDGIAHITGGGLVENPNRPLPEGCGIRIDLEAWEKPPIFHLLKKLGNVDTYEMLRTFNCGVGMIFFSDDDLTEYDSDLILIGEVIADKEKTVHFKGEF